MIFYETTKGGKIYGRCTLVQFAVVRFACFAWPGIFSVSGYRALVGDGINPLVVGALAAVYGSSLAQSGTVVVGRDSRPAGALLRDAVVSSLRAVGCDVLDIGVVPTPTVAREMIRFDAAGGIQNFGESQSDRMECVKVFCRRWSKY